MEIWALTHSVMGLVTHPYDLRKKKLKYRLNFQNLLHNAFKFNLQTHSKENNSLQNICQKKKNHYKTYDQLFLLTQNI
jgi:hypothetical protein